MHLQEWYDDDYEDYDANELKTAIKKEHDSLQKTNVFTRVQATDYNQQELMDVIQTKWVIRSRPGGTKNSEHDSWRKDSHKRSTSTKSTQLHPPPSHYESYSP
eukprot:2268449-Amphidinium_carterae.1